MNELVSIIIPAYNVEKCIKKCIESLIYQTYKNLEILIIDDGSTDDTRKYIDEYVLKDSRISAFDGGHKGVSHARNLGLCHAKGRYITFVDADDYLQADSIKKLVWWSECNDADVVVGGTIDVDEQGNIIKISNQGDEELQTADAFLRDIVICEKYTCVVWGKLYKTEAIGDCRFDENIEIAEDFDFLFKLSKEIDKIYYNSEPIYNWVSRESSAVHEISSVKLFGAVESHRKKLKDPIVYGELRQAFLEGYVKLNIRCKKLAQKQGDKNILSKCKSNLNSVRMEYIKCNKIRLKHRIKLMIKSFF